MLARTLLPRLARDLAAERARTAEIEAELADLKASSDPLRDLAAARETTRRIADRCLDLGRELEALRAAVRAHRAAHEAGEGETVALVRLYQLAKLA